MTSVNLPAAVAIGSNAFFRCAGLTTVSLPATTIGSMAFGECSNLVTIDLPDAVDIGGNAFYDCKALTTVNLPAATSIGMSAFQITGTGPLAVTLGPAVPTLGGRMFDYVTGPKTVTVKVPNNEAWSGIIGGSYTGSNTDDNWGNAFRGGGWNGTGMTHSSEINENITLTITAE
jgi:hypothetical protein